MRLQAYLLLVPLFIAHDAACSGPVCCQDRGSVASLMMSEERFNAVAATQVTGPCSLDTPERTCSREGLCTTCPYVPCYVSLIHGHGNEPGTCAVHVDFTDGTAPYEASIEFVKDGHCAGVCVSSEQSSLIVPKE